MFELGWEGRARSEWEGTRGQPGPRLRRLGRHPPRVGKCPGGALRVGLGHGPGRWAPEWTRDVAFPGCPAAGHKDLFIEGAHSSARLFVASSWGILSRV